MQILSPMVSAWSKRLAGRPLRERMRLLPIGAAVALAAIFLVSVTLGVLDPRSLTKIQRDYYPALRAGRDMRELLSDMQNHLQTAVSSRDSVPLSETDSLRGSFLTAVLEARTHSDNPEELDALGKRFEAYYASARQTSVQLIAGKGGDTVTTAVHRMTSDYNVLRAAIEANIRAQEQAIDAAFQAARTLQLSATFGVAMIALLAVLALGALSVATTQAVTRPLEEMASVAGRIAQGDLSVTTKWVT
jgi:methyl-accepting chemotaxis protein